MVTDAKFTVCPVMTPVHFVGVDLAWGQRSPTGVAVIDASGTLLHVGVAGDDDDVLTQLRPYVAGDCVVAIDAPLVVTNPSTTILSLGRKRRGRKSPLRSSSYSRK